MKKLISIAGVFILAFTVQSCDNDFLNVQPKTEIGGETFFNSADDLQMYLNGLLDWPWYGLGSGIFIEPSDDATTTGSAEYRNIMTTDLTSTQFTSGWDWNRLRNINYFLENFERADIPQAALDHYEGIARFYRARFYMEKVKRFGDVPWYDKVLATDDEDLFKGRDSREFVIDKIFEDYQFAADHVRPAGSTGEVDNWVVRTFMARHALHEGTFRKYHDYLGLSSQPFLEIARDQAQEIMDNGGFDLYSTGNPESDFGSLFVSTQLTGNPEIILVSRGIEGERNSGWAAGAFGGYEQSPTKDLLQSFLMDDGSYYSGQPGWETNTFVEEFENRDPRLSQTFAYPG
ncbi:MAG: RagB/SusD family nutrient uptake outer membrane protein, partial [Balneolales bacterium]